MKSLIIGAVSAAALVGAFGLETTATAAPGASSCFYTQQLTTFRPDGLRTIYASAGRQATYRIDLATECNALADTGAQLEVSPVNGAVCSPRGMDVAVVSNASRASCVVQAITRLTPEEAAALPSRLRP